MYRAEDTVSGRMAATLPFPLAASGFSADMAAKVRVKEAGVRWMCVMATEVLLPPDEVVELPHAAATRPSAATPAVMVNALVIRLKETTLFIESSL